MWSRKWLQSETKWERDREYRDRGFWMNWERVWQTEHIKSRLFLKQHPECNRISPLGTNYSTVYFFRLSTRFRSYLDFATSKISRQNFRLCKDYVIRMRQCKWMFLVWMPETFNHNEENECSSTEQSSFLYLECENHHIENAERFHDSWFNNFTLWCFRFSHYLLSFVAYFEQWVSFSGSLLSEWWISDKEIYWNFLNELMCDDDGMLEIEKQPLSMEMIRQALISMGRSKEMQMMISSNCYSVRRVGSVHAWQSNIWRGSPACDCSYHLRYVTFTL